MKYNSFKDLIDSIIEARKAKNLTQTELGKRLGLPQSYISKLESGRLDVRLNNIIEIARYLNLELFFVPTQLAPTVRSIVGSGKTASEGPLYRLDDDELEGKA